MFQCPDLLGFPTETIRVCVCGSSCARVHTYLWDTNNFQFIFHPLPLWLWFLHTVSNVNNHKHQHLQDGLQTILRCPVDSYCHGGLAAVHGRCVSVPSPSCADAITAVCLILTGRKRDRSTDMRRATGNSKMPPYNKYKLNGKFLCVCFSPIPTNVF